MEAKPDSILDFEEFKFFMVFRVVTLFIMPSPAPREPLFAIPLEIWVSFIVNRTCIAY